MDDTPIDQYPRGTDLLWMAHFRKHPDKGDMDGGSLKYDGTFLEAAKEVDKYCIEHNVVLQCLRRRF